jgi:hypothetical protein
VASFAMEVVYRRVTEPRDSQPHRFVVDRL